MSNVLIIIQREFNERVRKKSFILTTVLVPLLLVAMMAVPTLLMLYTSSDTKEIAVIDESGLIMPALQSNEEIVYLPTGETLDEARANTDRFGVLWIGEDILRNSNNVKLYTNSSSSMILEESIENQMSKAIEREKLKSYNIENLPEIMEAVKTSVTLQNFRNDKEEGTSMSAGASFAIGYVLAFVLYMFLIIYGQMVMQAVIEEKNSRVLDVLVTSVKPFQLMVGKILGVASVAVVQVAIWGVLLFGLGAVGSSVLMPKLLSGEEMVQLSELQAGTLDVSTIDPDDLDGMQLFATFTDFGYLAMIFAYLLLFLVGGYLLYSALFAAVGASVDNVMDAGQLTTPIILPIILALMIMFVVMKDPNSSLAFWCSIIPFTSPIVMMARIPAGIPAWEPILSLVVLYATIVAIIWIASRIYRVGILMHGKKPTLKELCKWMTYKY
ncbi:ABC transporter permease [uncultured Alistipes sp.]|uniref:ABC transporter permease n=1 Tax=uncultured Alistipes sp. TaxID=538949 RepID=UPI0032B29D5B